MNVKKEVHEKIVNLLKKEKTSIDFKLRSNLYAFKKLREEQTILKRERAEIDKLIRDITIKRINNEKSTL